MLSPRLLISQQGPEVSRFVAGFWRLPHWQFSDHQLIEYIETLLELGITTMDHARVYGSEAQFGNALIKQPGLRERIEIISKCGINIGTGTRSSVNHYDFRSQSIIQSVETTLRDLQTSHIDILLLHRPDYLLQTEEVASAFDALLTQGKVLHFGVSNYTTAQFERLQKTLPMPLVTNQVELSPVNMQHLDSGVLEQCELTGCSPMAWSCLGGGELFNKNNPQSQRLLITLDEIMEEVNAESIEAVIYAWIMALPATIIPILGSSQLTRIRSALSALNVKLSQEQWYRIWQASKGHPVP